MGDSSARLERNRLDLSPFERALGFVSDADTSDNWGCLFLAEAEPSRVTRTNKVAAKSAFGALSLR